MKIAEKNTIVKVQCHPSVSAVFQLDLIRRMRYRYHFTSMFFLSLERTKNSQLQTVKYRLHSLFAVDTFYDTRQRILNSQIKKSSLVRKIAILIQFSNVNRRIRR